MTPRVSGSRPYQRKNSVAAAIALVAMLTPALVSAQSEGIVRADSAAPRGTAASDSAARDSLRGDSVSVDSVSGDSVARDSLARDSVARDSLPGDSVVRDSARRAAPPQSPPPPADSLLGAACGETGGAPPDLVLVKFRLTATAAERAAVAGAVGGTVQGPSDHAPGSWYLWVPGSAGDRSVADRLIQMSPVLEVGVTRCSP
jgi:hypothetical protein